MTRLVWGALPALLLAGCGGMGGDGIPMSTVSTSGEIMTGTINPVMNPLNPTSTFALTSNTGTDCVGETDGRGQGEMRCTDGRTFDIAIPNYPSFSGQYTAVYSGETVAIGWGNQSALGSLSRLLDSS